LMRKVIGLLSGFLFSVSLTLLVLILLASSLTAYEISKEVFTTLLANTLKRQMNPQQLEQTYQQVSAYCKSNQNFTLPMMNENITMDCQAILATNSSYLVYLLAEKFFDGLYYKSYGCDFLTCLQGLKSAEDAIIFFSSTSHEFFKSSVWPVILLNVVIGIALLLSIEDWPGRCKAFGLQFLFIGVFFFLVPYLKSFTLDRLPPEAAIAENLLDKIFELISPILLVFFVAGIVLIGIWLGNKFLMKKQKPK